jgi:hypothetical protein
VPIKVLNLLSGFENVKDHESEKAFFRTHVPGVGPLAYLHVIFKPAPEDVLPDAARKLRMPTALVEFLRLQNGATLFSGALSVYGVHRPGQLLHREDPFFDLPFNIELENYNWPPADKARFLAMGGYGFDGSGVCIDRNDSKVYLFERGQQTLLPEPSCSWPSLDGWLTNEIARLSMLFDNQGRRVVDESQTLPLRAASS